MSRSVGLFDNIKKAITAVGDILSEDKQCAPKASAAPAARSEAAKPGPATPQSILDTGNIPPKPSTERSSVFYGGEDCDEYKMTFMLSGDLLEFNSHCELDPSYQYEPENDKEYTVYKENTPQLVFGPNDIIYDAIDKFLADGSATGDGFEKTASKYFLFKTRFHQYGGTAYAYAFSPDSAKDHEMLAVMYNTDVEGTSLEKKLMAVLDEAASTYREEKTQE